MDLNSCATSRREACMESMRSIVYHPQLVAVYHQATEGCTLARDEIQPQRG